MNLSFCRQLAAIILLVAVLLVPLTSLAHDLDSGVMKDTCACQLLHDGCTPDTSGQSSDGPCKDSGGCCDHEECCHESAEPPCATVMQVSPSALKLFRPYSAGAIPKVYLAIFVPPES
jgi:hypothetical protein